ncbi:MAG: FAD:protein FMN transferase [Oscillospiraceae bacterium]|nr:FAD:protein FMN transferase [Oscillospiraceae bacterium]
MHKISAALCVLIAFFVIAGCSSEQELRHMQDSRFMLDTFCTITIFYPDDAEMQAKAARVIEEAFLLILHYEQLFSISVEGSDIWRINHAGGAPTEVSAETVAILEAGIAFGSISEGKFDITVGRLTRLWDFSGHSGVPGQADLAQAIKSVGYQGIVIEGNTVTLENPETWLDLGGIAKGFILDSLSEFMRKQGVRAAVIDLGGDVAVVGERAAGRLWRIGVRHPFGAQHGLFGVIEIPEAASITSGIYERQFEQGGISYHHILNPRTGMPATSDIVSATVVTNSALAGDALTSAVMQAGSGRAVELLLSFPEIIGALLVLYNGEIIEVGDIAFEGV